MTKATGRAKPKNRRKKTGEEEAQPKPPSPSPPSPILAREDAPKDEDEDQPVPPQPDQPDQPASDGDGSSDEECTTSKVPELTPAQEQELAEFYEEYLIFYDKSWSDFKNAKKRERILQEKADAMKLTCELF